MQRRTSLGLTVSAGAAVVVGAVFTATATAQTCPIDAAIGMDTYRRRDTGQSAPDGIEPGAK